MPIQGFHTPEELDLELNDDGNLDHEEEEELKGWAIVADTIEADLLERVNFLAAYDILERHRPDSARLISGNSGQLILLVDPRDQLALDMARGLSTDISYGVPIDPDALREAIGEEAQEIWDMSDIAERVDFLMHSSLTLDHAFEDICPCELYQDLTGLSGTFSLNFR